MKALPAIAGSPFLAAKMPPVAAPLIIEFQGSSFFLMWIKAQSIVENIPPQTAKLPAMIGDLCFIAAKLPTYNAPNVLKQLNRPKLPCTRRLLRPDGALRNPLILWKTPPPIRPMVKAPPQSSTILHGHGSLVYSSIQMRKWIERRLNL